MNRYAIILILMLICASAAPAADALSQASWSPPKTSTIKQQVDLYLAGRELSDAARKEIDSLWSDAEIALPPEEALRRLVATLAAVDPAAKEVVDYVEQAHELPLPKSFAILGDENAPPLAKNNLRLLYGSFLARNNLFDEAAEQLTGLKAADVVDPASLLFYQAVAAHRLLKKDEAEPLLSQLLENEAALPKRYATVARLMQHDLEPLKPDSLDEISRMMDDVRRRLDLGRAGKKVRDEEAEIIAKLDKKLEDMQKQQHSNSNNNSRTKPSSPPARPPRNRRPRRTFTPPTRSIPKT
jgi:hypothetical protein